MIGCSMPNISVMAVFTNASRLFTMVFRRAYIILQYPRGSFAGPPRLRLLYDLEQSGCSHSAANAHRDDGVFGLAPAALDQRVARQPRSGHAIGMTDRDRTAVHVELFRIDAELVAAIDHLHREGFVQFPEIDIVDLETMTLEKPRHGVDRADPHLVGFTTCRDEAAEDGERF